MRTSSLLLLLATMAMPAATAEAPAEPPAVVVAVIGEAGLNPAHLEFRDTGGPPPDLPPHEVVPLPEVAPGTSFTEVLDRLAAGPLGRLEPGRLYRIDGTRLLVHVPAGADGPYDLIEATTSGVESHRHHGTGATSAAIGATTGTAPEAWAVFVPTSDPSGYAWLAAQDWIDLATVSSYSVSTFGQGGQPAATCDAAAHVRAFTRDRVFFASSGNVDGTSHYMLNQLPEFHLVGGVDASGSAIMAPRVPGSADADEIFFSVPYATRTFENGDRYEFQAADHDSVDGSARFGGTSGASPTTAGRAATVVAAARRLLGDDGERASDVLAERGAGVAGPTVGPLADGDLTAAELTTLLHAVAVPALTTPGRYDVEGYGALGTSAVEHATAVLRGDAPLPSRPADDADHERSEDARRRLADARGCG